MGSGNPLVDPISGVQAQPPYHWGRRDFVKGLAVLTGAAGLSVYGKLASAEPEPEISKIRFLHAPALCVAPQYLAEGLLRTEGFTDIEYVALDRAHGPNVVAAGGADISMWDTPCTMPALETGKVVILA